jgi:hypothetical protein
MRLPRLKREAGRDSSRATRSLFEIDERRFSFTFFLSVR